MPESRKTMHYLTNAQLLTLGASLKRSVKVSLSCELSFEDKTVDITITLTNGDEIRHIDFESLPLSSIKGGFRTTLPKLIAADNFNGIAEIALMNALRQVNFDFTRVRRTCGLWFKGIDIKLTSEIPSSVLDYFCDLKKGKS